MSVYAGMLYGTIASIKSEGAQAFGYVQPVVGACFQAAFGTTAASSSSRARLPHSFLQRLQLTLEPFWGRSFYEPCRHRH